MAGSARTSIAFATPGHDLWQRSIDAGVGQLGFRFAIEFGKLHRPVQSRDAR